MERYHRVGYIKTTVLFLLISLSIMVMAQGRAYAAPQYALQCDSCHGMPPADSATGDRIPDTGAFKGNHTKHLGAGAQPSDCTKCHNNTGYVSGHRNGTIDFSSNINNSPSAGQYKKAGAPVTFTNQTSVPVLGSCSTVNCHFESDTLAWGQDPTDSSKVNCNMCHTAPPSDGSHPSAIAGSGKKHGDYYGTGTTSCVKCHPSHTTFDHATSAGKRGLAIQFVVTPNSGGTYSGNVAYPNYLPSQNPARNGNCSNLYCHSNGKNGSANVTPQWGSTLPADCSGCHGGASTSQAPITTGKHAAHTNNSVYSAYFGCVECHGKTVSNNTTISTLANHVSGYVDYSGAKAGKSSTYSSAAGTCSSTYCHTDGKGRQNVAFTSANGWRSTATLDCKGCHGNDTSAGSFLSVAGEPNYANAGSGAPRANTHQKHVNTAGASTCVNCHLTTTTNGTSLVANGTHLDGAVTLAAGNGKSFTWTSNTKTCSAISCHNNGNATWGQTLFCANCHNLASSGSHSIHISGINLNGGVTMYNYTTNVSSGSSYGFGCANCHPVNTALHMNGSINVELNNTANVGSIRAKNTPTGTGWNSGTRVCDNVYCHSDGITAPAAANTPVWGGSFANSDRCANCHGNQPTTGAHTAHVVGIHYDDIFSGTSGKLAVGSTGSSSHGVAGQATTLNCDICHFNTVNVSGNDNNTVCKTCHNGTNASFKGAAAIANRAFHVNGRADVSFRNVAIVSKAQLRAESFVNYTAVWVRNSTNYKNGSAAFDTAKNALSNTMWSAGAPGASTCSNISCHVGQTVHWNDTLTCESCHTRL